MFVLVESLFTKSKVLARQESLGKCLKSRKLILQTSNFERVALFAAESELRFSITYTTFISKYSWFLHMRRIREFGFKSDFGFFWIAQVFKFIIENLQILFLMNLHQVRP